MLGPEGDFITSPEISQIFGEVRLMDEVDHVKHVFNRLCLVSLSLSCWASHVSVSVSVPQLLGVWVVSEWMGAGRPKRLQLVELGPGKGSLSADVLRVRASLWLDRGHVHLES